MKSNRTSLKKVSITVIVNDIRIELNPANVDFERTPGNGRLSLVGTMVEPQLADALNSYLQTISIEEDAFIMNRSIA